VLKVWHLGVGAAAAKMPPDRCWGKGNSPLVARTAEAPGYLERVSSSVYLRDMSARQSVKKQKSRPGACFPFLAYQLERCVISMPNFHPRCHRDHKRGRDPLAVEDDCLEGQENARKNSSAF
jgi:hypothetical protein